jgi:hypothetical protein
VAHSSDVPFSEGGHGDYNTKEAPMILVQDKDTKAIKASFSVGFTRKDNSDYTEGNIIYPGTIDFRNIDKDPEPELVTVWEINWGGSDGTKTIVVLDKVGDTMIPIGGLDGSPEDNSHFYLTDTISNKKIEFNTTRASDYTRVADINNDGISEILFASYHWEQDEGHYGDHIWDLYVYELTENGKKIPSWWNEGKSYTTTSKIGFDSDGEFKLMNEFTSKVKKI